MSRKIWGTLDPDLNRKHIRLTDQAIQKRNERAQMGDLYTFFHHPYKVTVLSTHITF